MAYTKAVGTAKLAREFFRAADLAQRGGPEADLVSLYLYCHGMELILKAALISGGVKETTLRMLGHDLTSTLRTLRRHPKSHNPILTRAESQLLGVLNRMYSQKEFEYLFTGFRQFPSVASCAALAARMSSLVPLIESQVREALKRERADRNSAA